MLCYIILQCNHIWLFDQVGFFIGNAYKVLLHDELSVLLPYAEAKCASEMHNSTFSDSMGDISDFDFDELLCGAFPDEEMADQVRDKLAALEVGG